MDLSKMIEALRKGGASDEEINEVVDKYSQAKYEPETIKLRPARQYESDKDVVLGGPKDIHRLRLMNVDDKFRALPKLINFVTHLIAAKNLPFKNAADLMDQTEPLKLIEMMIQSVIMMTNQGEYPAWVVEILEEIAMLTSTEKRQFTAEDLISLPGGQFVTLLWTLYEVNKQDFLSLWARVPLGLRSKVSTPVSRITSAVKNLIGRLQNPRETPSNGTPASTGKRSITSRSESKAASRKSKLAASV